MEIEDNISEDEYDIIQENSSGSDSEENEKDSQINNKKGSHLHTLKSKIKIIKYANNYSQKAASIKFSIPKSTISDWMKNKEKYLNALENKMNKKTFHEGKKIKNPELECKLIDFIEFNRKLYNSITTWSLLLKMFEISPERKLLGMEAGRGFVCGFLKRNFFSFRTKTHVGQILSQNCFTQASLFLN